LVKDADETIRSKGRIGAFSSNHGVYGRTLFALGRMVILNINQFIGTGQSGELDMSIWMTYFAW